jgi:hypothetical protein
MYNPLFVNILKFFFFPLDLQEKNHVAPKKQGGTLGISKKIIKNFQKIVKFFFFVWNRSIFTWKLKFIQC